ncbi:YciI family protein [Geomonas sp. RF6]|uniref:YciI-like protein n=1 Tax=Geomonas sp. RF6 TaxID=2897342 RepID=UPI001E4515F4|nr:YciI-like protein [Geomonas sp. RF6]UFS69039.1 YciI family protein [Geomonas sp. RF6]
MHYLLFYEVTPDYLQRRAEYRDEHLALAWQAQERGELILGGALADPADCAVLLFEADSDEVVKNFVAADPYVKNGLVSSWRVRQWTTVVGDDATSPVRPT